MLHVSFGIDLDDSDFAVNLDAGGCFETEALSDLGSAGVSQLVGGPDRDLSLLATVGDRSGVAESIEGCSWRSLGG